MAVLFILFIFEIESKTNIMQGYQLHDIYEDVVGTVLVPQGISDNVHEDWLSFVKENGSMANVSYFADLHGYIELTVDFVQP